MPPEQPSGEQALTRANTHEHTQEHPPICLGMYNQTEKYNTL